MNTMVFGLKTLVWCIRNTPGAHDNPEVPLISQFLTHVLKCLEIFTVPHDVASRVRIMCNLNSRAKSKMLLECFTSVRGRKWYKAWRSLVLSNVERRIRCGTCSGSFRLCVYGS